MFSLYVRMLLAMGAVFEMPTLVVLPRPHRPGHAGLPGRNIKYAILIIFIVAAVITPTADIMTQALMAAPMIALYVLSILIAWAFQKRKPADEA